VGKDLLRYDKLVEKALRSVVREALEEVAAHGLPGTHYFYLTFDTNHPGVDIPDHLRLQHPQEMTIVLQYQFWDLKLEEETFEVTLSFNKVHERLCVPFEALVGFADPSVQFGLQLRASDSPEAVAQLSGEGGPAGEPGESGAPASDSNSNVITLDSFRKK